MSTISPIDWAACVKQSNNKPKIAEELLNMLALELPNFVNEIQQHLSTGNIDGLAHQIHRLHGACCYCGANTLKQLLHDVEVDIHHYDRTMLNQKISQILAEVASVQQALAEKSYL